MDVPSGSSNVATLQEPVPLGEDPCHKYCCGQWAISQMNLPSLVLV
jgi:hypothetical protein